jgi:uncharacterized membrane protein
MVKRSEGWRDVRNFLIGGLYGASLAINMTSVVIGAPPIALIGFVALGMVAAGLVLTYWF